MAEERAVTPEERAEKRADAARTVLWHVAAFVIVNAYLWVIVPSAAVWVTLGWGIGLAFHLAAFFIGDDGRDNRLYRRFLAQERARDDADTS